MFLVVQRWGRIGRWFDDRFGDGEDDGVADGSEGGLNGMMHQQQ